MPVSEEDKKLVKETMMLLGHITEEIGGVEKIGNVETPIGILHATLMQKHNNKVDKLNENLEAFGHDFDRISQHLARILGRM